MGLLVDPGAQMPSGAFCGVTLGGQKVPLNCQRSEKVHVLYGNCRFASAVRRAEPPPCTRAVFFFGVVPVEMGSLRHRPKEPPLREAPFTFGDPLPAGTWSVPLQESNVYGLATIMVWTIASNQLAAGSRLSISTHISGAKCRPGKNRSLATMHSRRVFGCVAV